MDESSAGEYYLSSREYLAAVGKRLRNVRKKLGLTQKEAAFAAGISQPFLSAVERGNKAVSTAQIVSLIRFYKVPYEDILGRLDGVGSEDGQNRNKYQELGLGYELLELLIGEENSKVIMDNAEDCVNICAYMVFRSVYRMNPHNSERPFSISYNDAIRAATELITSAPDFISGYIGTDPEIRTDSLELPTERNEDMRTFIRESESLLKEVLRKNAG